MAIELTNNSGADPIAFGTGTGSDKASSGLNHTHIEAVFNRNFLKHAVDNLVLADVCEKFDLPQHAGTQTMRFFRRGEANVDNVRTLTEGTPLSAYTMTTIEKVEVALAQYGDLTKITDTRLMTDLIKQLELETARMGEEAALHLDTLIRDTVYTAYDTYTQTLASGTGYFIDKNSTTAADRVLKANDLDKAATYLHERRAPTFEGGHYLAILSPRQAYDLRQDSLWQNVGTYSDKEKIYKGEIGKLFNVKVITTTNPKSLTAAIDWNFDGDKTDPTGGGIVAEAHGLTFEVGMVIGRECLGTIKLGGTPGPMSPQLVINNTPDKTDPLNQYTMVGWKAWYAAKVLNEKFGVLIRSEQNALG